jgi:hypothetical protein
VPIQRTIQAARINSGNINLRAEPSPLQSHSALAQHAGAQEGVPWAQSPAFILCRKGQSKLAGETCWPEKDMLHVTDRPRKSSQMGNVIKTPLRFAA